MFWLPFLRPGPRLDWLQVEVTTACTAACIYCPRTVLRETWPERFLDRETFARLQPLFPRTRHVHLQGWGEPFLHPGFFHFLTEAKKAGCQVGATTNGMLATEAVLERCVTAGLDVLAFSLAGTDSGQDDLRRGTHLEQVLTAMKTLARLKATRSSPTPRVHVAYMLMASRLGDLTRLPRLLAGLGVAQVVISTLDWVGTPELAAERVSLTPAVAARLAAAAREAGSLGMELYARLPAETPVRARCPENPTRAAVVGADGAVAPCVFSLLRPRAPNAGPDLPGRLWGNLRTQTFPEIWNSPDYADFRQACRRGEVPAPCRGCLRLRGD